MMTREQIRELVMRYALACNAMLEFQASNLTDIYQQIWAVYLAGQSDIVIAVVKELASSDELPDPVRSYWREHQPKEAKATDRLANCILFGAKVIKLIKEGDRQKAIEEIKNLSSDFDDSSANYLVVRLQELL